MREAIRKALVAHFKANWTSPPFPVVFDNHNHNEAGAEWGRFSLNFGQTQPSAIGPDFTRTVGIMTLQVFIPEGNGTKSANIAADKLQAMFRVQRFNDTEDGRRIDIEIENGADGPTPKGAKEGFAQFHISVQFRADESPA